MNSLSRARAYFWSSTRWLQLATITFLGGMTAWGAPGAGSPAPARAPELEPHAREQIRLLHLEKLSRTPAQSKMSSQLVYLLRQKRFGTVGAGLNALKPDLNTAPDGRVLVDIRANVSAVLLRTIQANGGLVVNSFRRYNAIRALVPVELSESLAKRDDVRWIRPAARAVSNSTIYYEAGDIAHRAAEARQFFSADGTGVKIGVLSDSVDGLTNAQSAGALPSVTILPGQAGSGTGEGTAMLEIAHALAPGAQLYFATAFNSEASFAQNIRSLQAAGCKIIIDDVTYFDESPFQDGPIAQAVNDVSAAGTLYFSAAGNSGALDRGTSGTWEGDFKDAGPSNVGQGGDLHDFGGATYNTVLAGIGFERLDLTWSDPLGQSTNDYDVYVLDSSGNVVSSSTDNQSGSTDPYEAINSISPGQRIVIVKYAGVGRFLHLSTGRGRLTFATSGTTFGHNASGASNAFCVVASRVPSPPAPFAGGTANPLETFCSDGPRHIFYNPDGTAITPGDLSSTGGTILQKPDLTAADGVYTTVPGFQPFGGTSAAAPHLGAIAALLWSYNPFLTPAQIRSLLTSTALPISNSGFDRNSGFGIAMAYPALAAAPQALLQSVQLQDANQNGQLDPNECADLVLTLHNPSTQTVTGITAVLTSSTPQLYSDPTPRQFPDLPPNQTAVATVPFHISTSPAFVCGSNALLQLSVSTANLGAFLQPFSLSSALGGLGQTNLFTSTNVPLDIPDQGTTDSAVEVSGILLPLAEVRVSAYITHGYDQDLRISLISPDNTEVLLSANNGQSGQNYGASCQQPTEFSDDATDSITAASAPFVGVFTPQQPLSTFQGKSGAAVNGVWRLHVSDQAPQDVGTIQCWSLQLTPIGCLDGGGQCLSPPILTQNPSDQVVTNGGAAQFSVAPSGTGPFSYQWYFNTTLPLSDQTNATLVLTNITADEAGAYQVVITNVYGSITSAPASLAVVVPAAILTGPSDVLATNGDTVTLSVQAEGDSPLYYQWFFNQTNLLAGATNSTLALSNVTPVLAGAYEVWVSNTYASVTSAPATLRVLVPPSITCSPDTNVILGTAWHFSPPSYSDTNLLLQVLSTVTNQVCGESFIATRQWLVSDTNGYQLACSQTVQVLVTNPPALSCPADKTVVYGTPWTFDAPSGVAAGAVEAVVYDNWTNTLNKHLDPGAAEVGNQVTLEGTQRYPSRFALEYWGTNSSQATFAGPVTAEVRFYQNDGPPLQTGEATPGTVIFDSGPLSIPATNRAGLTITDFQANAALPLQDALPSNFTWTVTFAGLGTKDAAGLNLYGPPVIGQAAPGYWILGTNGWGLAGQSGQSFGGQLAALSSGVTITVVNTATNALCAKSFTAVRTWQIADGCSNTAACSQTVNVVDKSAPLVTDQSQDQSVLAGQTVSLQVSVSSCPPVGYQWYYNQTNALASGTNATLILTQIALGQSGVYQAVITNAYGSTTSAPVTLTVVPPPTIVSNPVDQVATNGDHVEFDVAAQGTGTLSYQWFFDGTTALPQQTNASLVLSNLTLAQAGTYQAVVSDDFGSVTSAPAHLQLFVLTSFSTVQGPEPIPDQGKVDSTVTISGMNVPLGRVEVGVYITHTYDADLRISLLSPDGTAVVLSANNGQFGQNYGSDCSTQTWFSDTATTNITDAGAPFLGTFRPQEPLSTFNGLSGSALNGVWTLRVEDTSPQDTGTLQCWSLRLSPMGCPAGGGECLLPPQIVQDISDQTATNGATVHWSVGIAGTQPLSYQWLFNGTNAPAGATNATLDLVNATAAQNGTYQVVVTNIYGAVTSTLANLTVIVPAGILTGPADQIATNGDTVLLSVVAQGTAPISYQWFFNQTNLLGAETNDSLVLSNVTPAQAGTYDVVVSNLYASVTSAPANLVVRQLPRIFCSSDTNFSLGVSWDFNPPSYEDTNLTLQVLGTVTNGLCGASFSATRQWLVSDTNGYQVTCSQTVQVLDTNPPQLTCAGDKSVTNGSSWQFDLPLARDPEAIEALVYDNWSNTLNQVLDPGSVEIGNEVTLDGTQRYPKRFSIGYWGTNALQAGFEGNVTAEVRFYLNDGPALPTGEATPGTILYDSGPRAINATNQGALVIDEFALSAAVPLQGALPTHFTWTVSFSGLSSNDAAGLALYGPPVTGQAASGYWAFRTNGWQLLGQSGQAFGAQLNALSSGVTLSVLSTVTNLDCAGTYTATRTWQAVDACSNASTCAQNVTVVDQSAPLVVSQPQDQALLLGQTLNLSVGVLSCPPVGYQWYFNETNAVPQGTNETLTITNISSAQAGSYEAVITNVYGSVTSAPALVVVQVPAIIVGSPTDQTATNGDDVHWRVLAKGSAPLFYQWYFNVTNVLDDATNSTLDLTNVSPAQAGTYQVIVTNVYGSATSAPAALTIVVPAMIVNDLSDQVVSNGDTVTWTIGATGTDPLSYQWYFNNGLLGLETNATLVLSNVLPAQAGVYQVVVANDYGSVTSAPANLTVISVPQVACSGDLTLPAGTAWDFTPPSYSDTNLILQVVSTTTNLLCGTSYSATRQWVVSDTNGFQVTCSQTVTLLDSAAPLLSCPGDKSVPAGSSWTFDLPSARESGAVEALVYDNWTNNLHQGLDPGTIEVGNQVTLGGTQRYPSRLAIEYWATNASAPQLAGSVTARVRFYKNDGPMVSTSIPSPGSIIYDSGPLPITATNRAALVLQDWQLSAAVPLVGPLPSTFVWTVRFEGLGNQDAAGLNLYGPPVVGQAQSGYWALETNGWTLQTGPSFGGQLSALSSGVTVSVVSTVTNLQCGGNFTATRNWLALDSCSNAASCGQTVNVVDQSPPGILSQPKDQAALLGQDVSFSVTVACPPTGYQWYFNQTNVLAQGTNATLLLTNLTLAQAGTYQVIISNTFGSTTSTPAVLSLSGVPKIVSQPASVVAVLGSNAVFTVSAVGVPPPSYQWLFNDTNVLAGQTGASLTLTNVQSTQAGFYSVVVSNSAGALTSADAQLTVVQTPLITSQPQNLTVMQGEGVEFDVTAVGTGPLSYQWMANCTRPISGATAPLLRLKSVSPTDSGSYCVVVSNAFGATFSQPAILRVLVQAKLTSITQNQTGATLSFSTVPNLLYSVYVNDMASGTNWTLLPNAFQQPGTGSPMTVQDPAATGAQRFYKIEVE